MPIYQPTCQYVSKFIDAFIEAVPQISSFTAQMPEDCSNSSPDSYYPVDLDSIDFPAKAALMIRSVRENNGKSKCKSVKLTGESSFRLLAVADRNASITLSDQGIRERDHGEGTYVTRLPLYDEFLDEDVSHLEMAYINRRREFDEEGQSSEYIYNDEWGRRLAGRRLRVIRTYDANIVNRLELSTESLDLPFNGISNVTDWRFLNGVRQLYLLGDLGDYWRREVREMIDPVIKLLPQLFDAFQGELIRINPHCLPSELIRASPEMFMQFANETNDAIDRLVRRGGDALALRACLKKMLECPSEFRPSGIEGCGNMMHFNWPSSCEEDDGV